MKLQIVLITVLFNALLFSQSSTDTINIDDDYLRCIINTTTYKFLLSEDEPCIEQFNIAGIYKAEIRNNEYALLTVDENRKIKSPMIYVDSEFVQYFNDNGTGKAEYKGELVEEVTKIDSEFVYSIPEWSKSTKYDHFIDKSKWFIGENDTFKSGKIEMISIPNIKDSIKEVRIFDDRGIKRIEINYALKRTLLFNEKGQLFEKRIGTITEPRYENTSYTTAEYEFQKQHTAPANYLSEFLGDRENWNEKRENEIWIYNEKGEIESHFFKVENWYQFRPKGKIKDVSYYDTNNNILKKVVYYQKNQEYDKFIYIFTEKNYIIHYYKNDTLLKSETRTRVYEVDSETLNPNSALELRNEN